MDLVQSIILALIQGITEFLPISSSAHLLLPKELLGWPDQGLAFDVAVHIGSLIAVITYFRKDVMNVIGGWFVSFSPATRNEHSLLAWQLIAATVPGGIAGLLFGDLIEAHLRSIPVFAATTILFGLLLWWADAKGSNLKTLRDMSLQFALIIGLAQAIALIPGTSRSGITITAALMLGFQRTEAARFSFLLAIPIIVLSGAYMSLKLLGQRVDWLTLLTGIAVSGVSAWLCIHYFLAFINRIGMLPFVIYRLFLGLVLIIIMFV
jgi:undecaprenyl-diphosphatase